MAAASVAAAVWLVAAPAAAQAAYDPGTVAALEQSLLQLRLGALGEIRLVQGGVELDPGYACGACATIFAGSPAALDAAGTYGSLRLGGTVVYAAGVATMLVAAFLPLMLPDETDWWGINWELFTGVLVAGSVAGAVGGILMGLAPAYLSDAVGAYNNDVFATARMGGVLPLGPVLSAIPGGARLGVGGSF
ncbi:MAG: hypothetical protein JXB32_12025 [Deltaproteobacteria bacterium]|nr:hypothetical protein [Deltaproteobacteria bacterium]